MKKGIFAIIAYILFLVVVYYLCLPAINLKSGGFYFYLILIMGFALGMIFLLLKQQFISSGEKRKKTYRKYRFNPRTGKLDYQYVDVKGKYSNGYLIASGFGVITICVVALTIIFSICGTKIFRANSYYKQLALEDGTKEEFEETFNYDDDKVLLPVIDKQLAYRLAEQNLGDYGAQYRLDYENFTLLSVQRNGVNQLVRIAPLEYSNFFVSLNRMGKGTIGYVEVNVVTSACKLVVFEDGLKYMPSAKLNKDLDRHVRFKHPTALYEEKYFEIDDEGNPWWVIPTYTNEISVFSGRNSTGVILVNPINGQTARYKIGAEPKWVDRVIVDTLVQTQATNALKYKNGFFNAVFGQKKEVFQVSDGYNYFIKDGHTYYVSCITSPNESDQTSIGFVTIDLKTRESVRYSQIGITEMRARAIAMQDERVKAQALEATWPILIDYKGIPTYFLVLKNDVKSQKIVYINVSDGGMVAMENSMEAAKNSYDALIASSGIIETATKEIIGTVVKVRDMGNTIEFMIRTEPNKYFSVNVSLNNVARFIEKGEVVFIIYKEYSNYNYVIDLRRM